MVAVSHQLPPEGNTDWYDHYGDLDAGVRNASARINRKLPLRLQASPQVMTSPPTVTVSAENAATTIASPQTVAPDTTAISRLGAGGFSLGDSYPFSLFQYPTSRYPHNVTDERNAPSPWTALFGFDGSELEFLVQGRVSSATYWLSVDGERVTSAPQTPGYGSGAGYRIKLAFGAAKRRIIQIDMSQVPWGGLTIGPTDTVWPVTPRGPRVIFVGDSYLGGAYTQPMATFYRACSDLLGWQDVWNDGFGSTGYVVAGYSAKFAARVAGDVVAYAPDIVVFAGGINDAGHTTAEVEAEALSCFTQVKTALPNTLVIATGPWVASGDTSAYVAVRNGIRNAAQATGATFIDTVDAPWITGSGHVGGLTGSGNADRYIAADGVHPTAAGSEYLGCRLAEAILASVPAL